MGEVGGNPHLAPSCLVGATLLGSLRRVLVRLQRLLAPEPAALFRLLNRPPAWLTEDDVLDLRQAAEEFNTTVADSAALVERIRLLQEELAALISEQNNKILFVLTVVTVLALPFNIVGGLFGMNVGGIPFAEDGHGFATIIAFVALGTGIAAYLIMQRREAVRNNRSPSISTIFSRNDLR